VAELWQGERGRRHLHKYPRRAVQGKRKELRTKGAGGITKSKEKNLPGSRGWLQGRIGERKKVQKTRLGGGGCFRVGKKESERRPEVSAAEDYASWPTVGKSVY